ncbi:hypothetical protein [Thalassovita aquimarina]|uniref:hypothetical protein n=1 Tax=Thalassovita aquimarina TaxID=2785917 RepID=UPI003564CF61
MACSITINPPIGSSTGGVLDKIKVSGTAEGCRSVSVTIFCQNQSKTKSGIPVDTGVTPNAWEFEFDPALDTCACGSRIDLVVKCDDGEGNCDNKAEFNLDCPPTVGMCPTVQWTGISIGDCNANGTSTVNISAQLNSAGAYSADLKDSGGTVLDTVAGPGAQTLSVVGDYSGSETFTVEVTSPANCPGISIPLSFPSCQPCPDTISSDYEIGPCDEDGNRELTVTATLTPASGDPYAAELRDAVGNVLAQQSGTGTLVLTHTQMAPGGSSVVFKVVVTDPAHCNTDHEITIDIPPCVCPEISFFHVVGEKCDDQGRRSVTVQATLTAPAQFDAELQDSNGTVLDQVSGSGSQTLSHTGPYSGNTNQTFNVVVTSPAGCDGGSLQVQVPSCEPSEPPTTPPTDDEGFGCGLLRLLVAIAAALAILAGLLALCVPPAATALWIAAAAAAIAALVGGIIYAIFCPNKPCNVALLISGQSTLAAGVVAIVLSGCCPWVLWAGLGLAVSGLGLLEWWRRKCDKSICDLAKEITKVIGGVILPVLGALVGIPGLGACFSAIALAWISAIFGPIAAFASTC